MSCLQTGFERGDLKLDCFSHIANAEKAAVETKKLRESKNCRIESKFQFRRSPEVETLKGQLETELVQVGTDTNTDSCGLVSTARIQLGSAVRAELCEDKRQSCAELSSNWSKHTLVDKSLEVPGGTKLLRVAFHIWEKVEEAQK